MIGIGIIGYGVIGKGTATLLTQDTAFIQKQAGQSVELKAICDIQEPNPSDPLSKYMTKDFNTILEDKSIQIVVEAIGGKTHAYTFTKALLEAGKHVVTSNKELVANYGDALLDLAQKNKVRYLYEASVGGGIPIIRPLHTCVLIHDIDRLQGIVNGTTNYILTEMFEKGMEFADALKDAQERGYAEKDPSADIDGIDASRKLAILTNIITGKKCEADDIYTEGIRFLESADIEMANALGYQIKLLAQFKKLKNGVYRIVAPHLVPNVDILASVRGVFNAIQIRGEYLGEVAFYGQGAGAYPTASAILADILDIVMNPGELSENYLWNQPLDNCLAFSDMPVKGLLRLDQPMDEIEDYCKEANIPYIKHQPNWIELGQTTEKAIETLITRCGLKSKSHFIRIANG